MHVCDVLNHYNSSFIDNETTWHALPSETSVRRIEITMEYLADSKDSLCVIQWSTLLSCVRGWTPTPLEGRTTSEPPAGSSGGLSGVKTWLYSFYKGITEDYLWNCNTIGIETYIVILTLLKLKLGLKCNLQSNGKSL